VFEGSVAEAKSRRNCPLWFQVRAELHSPSRSQPTRFLEKLAARLGGDLGFAPRTLADKLVGASFAELEEFALDVRRRAVS
jgi:hypothetical protein